MYVQYLISGDVSVEISDTKVYTSCITHIHTIDIPAVVVANIIRS